VGTNRPRCSWSIGTLEAGRCANTVDGGLRESAAILTEKPLSFSPKDNILLVLQFPMLTCKTDAQQNFDG
jgi:hypothetical protein